MASGLKDRCRNVYSCWLSREVGKFTKYRVLIGAMLLIFPNPVPWFMGNILPYAYSYFRCNLHSDAIYENIVWVVPIFLILSVSGTLMFDFIRKFLSVRAILVLAIVSCEIGMFLTSFTVSRTAWGLRTTLSIFTGFGLGVNFAFAFVIAGRWFADNAGLATSAVGSSQGLGAIVCTTITTAFMNPDNLKPDQRDPSFYYFSQKEINDRFPDLFLYLGAFSVVSHVIAFCLLDVAIVDMDRPLAGGAVEMVISCSKTENYLQGEESPLDVLDNKATPYTLEQGHNCSQHLSHQIQIPDSHGLRHAGNYTLNSRTTDVNHCGNRPEKEFCHDDRSATGKGPLQVLRSELFYYVWIGTFTMTIAFVIVTSNYKLFGLLWIHDDEFFTVVGTTANVATVVCRVCFGIATDKLGVFNAIAAMMATNTVGMAFWYFTPRLDRWLYLTWTSFLIGLQSSTYTVFPVAALRCFGTEYYSTNVGLIFFSIIAASFLTPALTSFLVTSAGLVGLIVLGSAPCLVSVVLLLARISALNAADV